MTRKTTVTFTLSTDAHGTKGAKGVITSKAGDRAWMLNVPDLPGANGLIADYTELEAADGNA